MKENTEYKKILKRYAKEIIGESELWQKFPQKKLIIKFGADPTRPDLHLGHTVILRIMKILQEYGHEIVFIIGDYTAMIGDPSGKSKTRTSLTYDETRASGETYYKQVTKILDPDKTRIVYNSDWLSKLRFVDILSIMEKYTLAQLLAREDFKKRFQLSEPISMHEMLYPLIQGYDSVAIDSDVELGGTDQTFNLLVGRDMQKAYNQEPQVVITFPLLVGLDGKNKMSKSLDNYIGINEPPHIMFEKCMKIPDSLLIDYFRYTTDVSEDCYLKWIETDIFLAHKKYAYEIIKTYHGENYISKAEERYIRVAKGELPNEMNEFDLERDGLNLYTIVDLLFENKIIKSKSEGRRLINQGGVSCNGIKVREAMKKITTDDIKDNKLIIKIGKSRFYRFNILNL